ncbi:MAG: hypothetical protein J6X34_03730 [Clostridia bacterium]|nr:hypothetical protein [Clostridia bacterium]
MDYNNTTANQEPAQTNTEPADKPAEDSIVKSQADAQKPVTGSTEPVQDDSKSIEKTYTEKEVQKRIKDALAAEKKTADDKAETALREITALKNQTACYKAGVREECIEDAITLASKLTDDKTDFGKALAKVLEKYPQFKNAEKPVTTGTKTKDNTDGGSDAALRKAFGLS